MGGRQMKSMTATNAAKNFGELVDTVQDEPVTIESRGRAVAVVYSYGQAMALEAEADKAAQESVMRGMADAEAGRTMPFNEALVQQIKAEVLKELEVKAE